MRAVAERVVADVVFVVSTGTGVATAAGFRVLDDLAGAGVRDCCATVGGVGIRGMTAGRDTRSNWPGKIVNGSGIAFQRLSSR